jgi:hypothetical protein
MCSMIMRHRGSNPQRPLHVETNQFDLRVWAAADDTTEPFAEFWQVP